MSAVKNQELNESIEERTNNVEVCAPEPYDFEFIANALGLIPYQALGLDDQTPYRGAFNIGALVNIEICDDGNVALTLHGGEEILMSRHQFAQIEQRLRGILNNARVQGRIVGVPTGKNWRPQ
jgi:hypothetical protein